MIQIAGNDLLRDEAIGYAEALEAAGVQVDLHVYKGLAHGFYLITELEESRLHTSCVVEFVQRCIKGSTV